MWRRTLKVMAVSYAVKTILLLGVWLAAPDLVRRGRERANELWDSWTRTSPPAAAAIAPAFPHAAAAAAVGTASPR
jgi:hypothetical protein